jgi:ABC-type transport system involved in multi-copper enzyme maturation permease subunit
MRAPALQFPEAKAVLGWLVAAALLVWAGRWLSLPEWIILGLIWVGGLFLLLRRVWVWVLGPLFFYDVVRTARRNWLIPVRCLYAGFLVLILFMVYTSWFGMPRTDWRELFEQKPVAKARLSEFAEGFSHAFMLGQLAVIVFLTPLFVADVVSEERERRTLNLLLATAMSDREIVFGLLACRLANLGMIVLTGLPILSLMPFLGGVDPLWVVISFLGSMMTMIMLGAMSILVSINSKTSITAIVTTYACCLFMSPCLAAILPAMSGPSRYTAIIMCTLIQTGLIFAFVIASINQLRGSPREPAESLNPAYLREALQKRSETTHRQVRERPPVLEAYPQVSGPPVLWKDFYRNNRGTVWTLLHVAILVVVVVLALPSLSGSSMRAKDIYGYLGAIGAAAVLFPVPLLASQMVSREYERRTLDCLLATPLEAEDILLSKFHASVLGTRWALVLLAGVFMVAAASGAIHRLAFVLLIVSWIVYAAFLACLGLFLSTLFRSTRRATLLTILLLLALGVGGGYSSPTPRTPTWSFQDWVLCILRDAGSPLSTWKILAFDASDIATRQNEIRGAILAVFFIGMTALALWKMTVFEFRRMARKGSPN